MRIHLRHIDIQAQGIDLRHGEQRLAGAAIAGVDQVADIDIAPGDDAVKRRHHLIEALKLAQAPDVGIRSGKIRLGLVVGALTLIQILLRHRVLFPQALPAIGGALRQGGAGVGLRARRHGLRQFLFDLRRGDLGQQFTLVDRTADVLAPTDDIAVAARIDRRFDDPQQRPRQRERLPAVSRTWA